MRFVAILSTALRFVAILSGGGIAVLSGGTLSISGSAERAGWQRVGTMALRGANELTLREPLSPGAWLVGDAIVVSTTDYNRQPQVGQNEEHVVAAVSADGLTVRSAAVR